MAALEEKLAHPLLVTAPEITDEQAAQFREGLDEALRSQPFRFQVLPPRPLLTPGTARELLRECVTVVKPGEVLVVRASDSWTPMQVRELQYFADAMNEYRELGVAILFMPGEEFAVAKAREES